MRPAILLPLALAACAATPAEPPLPVPLPALVTDNLPEGIGREALRIQDACYVYAASDGTTRRVTDPDGLPVCLL